MSSRDPGSVVVPGPPSGGAGAPGPRAGGLWLIVPLAALLVVTAGLFIWSRSVTPDPNSSLFGQKGTGTFSLKAWMATGVLALAFFQLYTALWLYGRINKRRPLPRHLGIVHRLSGVGAIVLSLPIAYNCIFAYGFEDFDNRVLLHALAGCFFYGAFAAKVIIVRSKRLPGWTLPAAGGTLIVIIALLWYSAALWKFNNYSVPLLSPDRAGAQPNGSTPYGTQTTGAPAYGAATAGGAASGAKAASAVKDTIINYAYKPNPITVAKGGAVTWTNQDSSPHTSTADSGSAFDTGTLNKGQSKTITFTKVGTFHYHCVFHPFMHGTVIVR